MSRRLAYAIVVLFVLGAVPGWTGMFWIIHNEHAAAAARVRQGEVIEQKLCTTLGSLAPLAALQAPAGDPVTNPSRAYLQELNRALQPLAQLGPDIGCGKG